MHGPPQGLNATQLAETTLMLQPAVAVPVFANCCHCLVGIQRLQQQVQR